MNIRPLQDRILIQPIRELLSIKGETEIFLVVKDKKKQAHYSLGENRKFYLNHLQTHLNDLV